MPGTTKLIWVGIVVVACLGCAAFGFLTLMLRRHVLPSLPVVSRLPGSAAWVLAALVAAALMVGVAYFAGARGVSIVGSWP
jgi:hypothetical protein